MKAAFVCAAAISCVIAGALTVAIAADPMAYGRHLSGECVTCHKLDGTDTGIPSITGWDSPVPNDDQVPVVGSQAATRVATVVPAMPKSPPNTTNGANGPAPSGSHRHDA